MKTYTKFATVGFLAFASSFCAANAKASPILLAADNCFAVGQQYAQQHGATLVAAEAAVQGGQNVCKVVVLEPSSNGERPKREIIFIPQ